MLFIGDQSIYSLKSNGIAKEEKFNVEASSSATASSILSAIDGYSYKPKAIMLMLGINDISSNNADPKIDDIKKVIEKLKTKFPKIPIYVMPTLPTTKAFKKSKDGKDITGQYDKERVKKYNQLLEEYCNNTDLVNYIDITENLVGADGYLIPAIAQSDGIQLNKQGGNILIENIKSKMSEYQGSIDFTGGGSGSVFDNFVGEPNYVISGDDTKADFRVVDVNDRLELMKHILFTEKYDFNRIKWKQYSHTKNGEDSPLKEDLVYGLKYPSDSNNTKLGKFVSLVLPYLQSWYIPLSMTSGVLTSGTDENNENTKGNPNFTYSLLQNTYHDIIVHRYDLQKYVLKTKYKEYTQTTYQDVITVKMTQYYDPTTHLPTGVIADHWEVERKKIQSADINERVDNNGHESPLKEEYVSDSSTETTQYFLAEAKTFDMTYENTFNYTKYSESDVLARQNPKSAITQKQPYHETIMGENKIPGASYFGSFSSFEDVHNRGFQGTYPPNSQQSLNPITTVFTYYGGYYMENDGNTIFVDRTWEDTLSQSGSKSKSIDYDALIEYNSNLNKDPNKDSITQEDFEKNKDEGSGIYKALSSRKELNKIDLLNSNPKLMYGYLSKGREYKKYIGYSRSYLSMAYANLKKLVKEAITKNNGVLPYAYFSSLGFEINTSKTDQTTVKDLFEYNFNWPVNIEYNEYAKNIDVIYGKTPFFGEYSKSIYIPAGKGQNNVLVSKDGKVAEVKSNSVLIEHEGKIYTRYSNIKDIDKSIKQGKEVKAGDIIGVMAEDPKTKNTYLDFQMYKDGSSDSNTVDPLDYFVTEPEYGSIDPTTITKAPSGYKFSKIKTANSEALVNYIHMWEAGSEGPKMNADGTKYIVVSDGYGHQTVGWGIDIFNGGFADVIIEAGYETDFGSEIDKAFIDALEEQELKSNTDAVNSRVSGLNLKDYQIHALISRVYNGGAGTLDSNYTMVNNYNFAEAYKAYWDPTKDDLFGKSEPNFEHKLYTNFMMSPRKSNDELSEGLIRRRKSEWRLFQTGEYNIVD
ncbi:MAG: peptidoglycan DD-metalloendopeptidase family protein [Clostridia bacterium]|nr:peptidoglycan DD-metalloendopeptidase family protein [Clostridia bacterium]